MRNHGYFRTAAASPRLRVGDCAFNAERTISLMRQADVESVGLLIFPEMGLTGYTCADLFHTSTLQEAALDALKEICIASEAEFDGVVIVGLPLVVEGQLYNVAAIVHHGNILGIVPKRYLPNYGEFYDPRYFSSAATDPQPTRELILFGHTNIPFGTDLLFEITGVDGLTLMVEICEDLWAPIPPSSFAALTGATVIANLSASNETIGKADYRRQLVRNQSARCLAAYVYAGAGIDESTTDLAFAGHCLIAENGTLLAESKRFARDDLLILADVDLQRLTHERIRMGSFHAANTEPTSRRTYRRVRFTRVMTDPPSLRRPVESHPFVPRTDTELRERCEEIFHIQVTGLARRLEQIGIPNVAIGVSGGLDSTLALLVAARTMDVLGVARDRILARTMPGFGTSRRTLDNAGRLMNALSVTASEIDIRSLCLEEMRLLGHHPFGIDPTGLDLETFVARLSALPPEDRVNDLVFENVQARVRTNLLMNTGFVIGTGDLSELALGWCTYNADHMSMYNPNVSVPKTLVKFLVEWAAQNEFTGDVRDTLLDVVATEPSPELLPTNGDGEITHRTEDIIGPYELHDFFLYHFLRHGCGPEKILFLAQYATFDRDYDEAEVRRWLRVFVERFFKNQFKRSCLPDGPKVGSVSLSPRGDWRMPSDASAQVWLRALGDPESR